MYFAFRTSCYGNCAKFTLLCNTKIKHLLFAYGWNHQKKPTHMGVMIFQFTEVRFRVRQAIALLRSDIATAERAVQDNITAHMSQPQYDALVSLAYNIGASGFKNSTVVKYINNPDFHSSVYSDLESAWKAWNRTQGKVSNGLINRRQNEWNLYKRGIY